MPAPDDSIRGQAPTGIQDQKADIRGVPRRASFHLPYINLTRILFCRHSRPDYIIRGQASAGIQGLHNQGGAAVLHKLLPPSDRVGYDMGD
jgi:hypothetical protein